MLGRDISHLWPPHASELCCVNTVFLQMLLERVGEHSGSKGYREKSKGLISSKNEG